MRPREKWRKLSICRLRVSDAGQMRFTKLYPPTSRYVKSSNRPVHMAPLMSTGQLRGVFDELAGNTQAAIIQFGRALRRKPRLASIGRNRDCLSTLRTRAIPASILSYQATRQRRWISPKRTRWNCRIFLSTGARLRSSSIMARGSFPIGSFLH